MQEILSEIKIPNLQDLGNVVPEGYKYYKKKITSEPSLNINNACLKWYDLYPTGQEIKKEQIDEAMTFIETEVKTGRLELHNELGFVILHRAGEYLLLLITTWRNTNEMWESIYLKKESDIESYSPLLFNKNHKGTYCVWELGIVWHERNSWVRFI